MCSAINMIDASALESLEAISDRLRSAGVTFHLSEVKGPVMDALERSDFFEHLTGPGVPLAACGHAGPGSATQPAAHGRELAPAIG